MNKGKLMMIVGVVIFLLNGITYTLWEIDIDIIGALVFLIGLCVFLYEKYRNSQKENVRFKQEMEKLDRIMRKK